MTTNTVEKVDYKKTIIFGKVDYNGTGRKVNEVTVKIELKNGDKGLGLSICGSIWNHIHSDILSGGQNIDTIAELLPHNKKVKRIKEIWELYHLNDMKAGCEHQRAEKWEDRRIPVVELPGCSSNRDERGFYAIWIYPLESKGSWFVADYSCHKDGLLTKPCAVCGYKYGSAWLFEEIPAEIITEIKSW